MLRNVSIKSVPYPDSDRFWVRGVYCETAMLCPEAEVISTNENADLMTADQSQASNRSSLVVISADLTCHDATMELVVTSLPCQ